jgi:hypothetical protein
LPALSYNSKTSHLLNTLMPVRIFPAPVFLAFLLGLSPGPTLCAKNLYRWVDEHGNTFFADQISPEYSRYQRELLNRQGRIIKITEKAKNKEQLELENRLAELRKEEEKLISLQKIHDNALLSTFRNKEDIAKALQEKMDVFATQKRVIEGSLKHLREQLEKQQKLAAAFERNGQKAPQRILDNISSIEQQIQQNNTAVSANLDKQRLVENEYNADMERFLFLTQSVKRATQQTQIPSIKQANSLGLFYCENDHQCNKAWEISRTFINLHSTTLPDVYNDKLIMNRPPAKDSDISLSLSRIAITDNDYQLFLDIHCHDSISGRELCASPAVKDIRFAFRPYINEALSRPTQQ